MHFTIEDDPRLDRDQNDIKTFLISLMQRYDGIYHILSNSSVRNLPYAQYLNYNIANKGKAIGNVLHLINKLILLNKDNIHLTHVFGCIFTLYQEAISNENSKQSLYCQIILDIAGEFKFKYPDNINNISDIYKLIDRELLNVLQNIERQINNNKNTALDDEKPTTNTLDTLEEQKDDPQGGRVGRDFKSVQWTEKVTPARLNSPDNEQVRMNFRTFPQIKAAIKKACKQSGEIQNEWIVRAALDRLKIDHPEIYKELESQKNEFPKVRHDAKHGVDLLIK